MIEQSNDYSSEELTIALQFLFQDLYRLLETAKREEAHRVLRQRAFRLRQSARDAVPHRAPIYNNAAEIVEKIVEPLE